MRRLEREVQMEKPRGEVLALFLYSQEIKMYKIEFELLDIVHYLIDYFI